MIFQVSVASDTPVSQRTGRADHALVQLGRSVVPHQDVSRGAAHQPHKRPFRPPIRVCHCSPEAAAITDRSHRAFSTGVLPQRRQVQKYGELETRLEKESSDSYSRKSALNLAWSGRSTYWVARQVRQRAVAVSNE